MGNKTFKVVRLDAAITRIMISVIGVIVGVMVLTSKSNQNMLIGIIVSIFCILPLLSWYQIHSDTLTDTLMINAQGVTYQKSDCQYFLSWDEINSIRVGGMRQRVIYFNGGGYEQQFAAKRFKDFNATYFGADLRFGMIEEIEKYWDKSIEGGNLVIGRSRF